jgi:hypothetical protein
MDKRLNLNGKLDFSDIDLTAPDKVIEEILSQLPEETNGIIFGKIQPYNGHVFSYKMTGLSGIAQAISTAEKTVDIQEDLGKIGGETHKFECFLYTPEYDKYKYRVFFVKYDIANYPVSITLDESVSKSISNTNTGYIYTCNTREELEELIFRILSSKRIVAVMQELIRINQAKKDVKSEVETNNTIAAE